MNKDEKIKEPKKALRKAIFDLSRVDRVYVKRGKHFDTCDFEWNKQVRKWATLCDFDIDNYDPGLYGR